MTCWKKRAKRVEKKYWKPNVVHPESQKEVNEEFMLKFEKECWNNGIENVGGVDEAGRGPLAGPVVAACVIFDNEITLLSAFSFLSLFFLIRDIMNSHFQILLSKYI